MECRHAALCQGQKRGAGASGHCHFVALHLVEIMPILASMGAVRCGRFRIWRRHMFRMAGMRTMRTMPAMFLRDRRGGKKQGAQPECVLHMPPIGLSSIQIAMPTMKTFSVKETKPSGTLLDPPTHAHLSARRSI